MSQDSDQQLANDSRFSDVSTGKLLAEGRERAGLSQEQVAKELFMTLSKVRMLESDDYSRVGSNTFARGYVRAYANLLKLDVEHILAVYDAQAQRSGLVKEYVPPKPSSANVPMGRFILLIGAGLTLLWLISMWFFDNRQAPEYQIKTPVVSQLTPASAQSSSVQLLAINNANSSVAVNAPQTTDGQLSDGVATNVNSSVAAELSLSEAGDDGSVMDESAQANTSGLDELRFSFDAECWLEVSDSQGDVLMTDLQRAGSELVVEGKAPFDVKLGNAPAVDMYLNGKEIAIVPAIGTDVLNLKVPE